MMDKAAMNELAEQIRKVRSFVAPRSKPIICAHCGAKIYGTQGDMVFCPKCEKPWKEAK